MRASRSEPTLRCSSALLVENDQADYAAQFNSAQREALAFPQVPPGAPAGQVEVKLERPCDANRPQFLKESVIPVAAGWTTTFTILVDRRARASEVHFDRQLMTPLVHFLGVLTLIECVCHADLSDRRCFRRSRSASKFRTPPLTKRILDSSRHSGRPLRRVLVKKRGCDGRKRRSAFPPVLLPVPKLCLRGNFPATLLPRLRNRVSKKVRSQTAFGNEEYPSEIALFRFHSVRSAASGLMPSRGAREAMARRARLRVHRREM